MIRWLCILTTTFLLSLSTIRAQQVVPAPPAPGQPAVQPPPQTSERSTTFPMFAAAVGAALVLVVVCYPSRRHG